MSSVTKVHITCQEFLSLLLWPGGSVSNIILPIHPLSLLSTRPNLLHLNSPTLSTNCSTVTDPLICSFLILAVRVTTRENIGILSWASCLLESPAVSNHASLSQPALMNSLFVCFLQAYVQWEFEKKSRCQSIVRAKILFSVSPSNTHPTFFLKSVCYWLPGLPLDGLINQLIGLCWRYRFLYTCCNLLVYPYNV